MPDLASAYAHCEAQLRAEDHDSWLATLYAPAAARPRLQALGAFALEVGHVKARVRQAMAGEIRLQWWQEVVDGARPAEAAAHPVAAALVDTLARAALPAAPLGNMLDALRSTLYDGPPADLPALERRFVATHGTPVRLAARVLGGGPALDAAADDAGVALGAAALLDGGGAGPLGDDLRALARSRLATLRGCALGPAAPAFLVCALVEPGLAGDALSPLRRQWRIWRAARRGGRP